MLRKIRNLLRNKQGQGLVEYALLIAGVALISAAAVSVFGHKTSDLISAVATILPGAHADDNGPMVSGKLIETTGSDDGPIALDAATIAANVDTSRLGNNVLGADTGSFGGLVVEASDVVAPTP
jgi:pilus assembly protein Flp/PilA